MRFVVFIGLNVVMVALSACQIQEALTGGSPDEFRVTKYEPLETPPDMKLRDPKTLRVSEKASLPVKTADVLLGAAADQKERDLTHSDQALLRYAHIDKGSPTLRRELEQENRLIVAESRRSLFGSKKGRGRILNPEAEQKRLEENKKKELAPHIGQPEVYDRGSDNPSDNL